MSRFSRLARPHSAGFTLIELMIVVAIIGILAAIAIPNFLRYQAQARQSEAKTNLSGIFVAETTYYGEQSSFGTFNQVGFTLVGSANRYTYRSGGAAPAGGASSNTAGQDLIPGAGGLNPEGTVTAFNSQVGFTATAAANLDNDPTVDQWHINDLKQNLVMPDSNDVSG